MSDQPSGRMPSLTDALRAATARVTASADELAHFAGRRQRAAEFARPEPWIHEAPDPYEKPPQPAAPMEQPPSRAVSVIVAEIEGCLGDIMRLEASLRDTHQFLADRRLELERACAGIEEHAATLRKQYLPPVKGEPDAQPSAQGVSGPVVTNANTDAVSSPGASVQSEA
jgi:hypothetical protein